MRFHSSGSACETGPMISHRLCSLLAVRLRRWRLPLMLGGLALPLAGCVIDTALAHSEAAAIFSRQNVCPRDRMAADALPVRPQDAFERGTPPAEVAADPGRLRVWERNADADLASFHALTFVEMSGCGVHEAYLCWEEPTVDGILLVELCPISESGTPAGTPWKGFTLERGVWASLRAAAAAR